LIDRTKRSAYAFAFAARAYRLGRRALLEIATIVAPTESAQPSGRFGCLQTAPRHFAPCGVEIV
jgi:hypothetical protein